MSDSIRVAVAPGNFLTIAHPSALPGLPPVALFAGETHLVARHKAEQLYRDGKILHPTTGQPRSPLPAPAAGLMISGDQTSWQDMARLAEEARPAQPTTVPPSDFTFRGSSPFREAIDQTGGEIGHTAVTSAATPATQHQRPPGPLIWDEKMRDRRPIGFSNGGRFDVEPRDQLHRNGI